MGKINDEDPEQVYDTSVGFPEEVRRYSSRSTDFRKIWDYLELLFYMLMDSLTVGIRFQRKH
jgi:hypothetical protein